MPMKISALKEKMAAREGMMLLDVREPDEVADGGMMPGAVNIPMGKVFVEAGKGALPKDTPIVTICRSGVRAEIVARELKERGYDVDFLEGGMTAWEE